MIFMYVCTYNNNLPFEGCVCLYFESGLEAFLMSFCDMYHALNTYIIHTYVHMTTRYSISFGISKNLFHFYIRI